MMCFLCVRNNREAAALIDRNPDILQAAHTFVITLQRAGYFCGRKFFKRAEEQWAPRGRALLGRFGLQQAIRHGIKNICVAVGLLVFSLLAEWTEIQLSVWLRLNTYRWENTLTEEIKLDYINFFFPRVRCQKYHEWLIPWKAVCEKMVAEIHSICLIFQVL